MGFLFSRGGNFREEDKSAKITPHENFHVYSSQWYLYSSVRKFVIEDTDENGED